ncbi:hypothetical protein C8R44DRAFT_866102 [Mycena epipterygia]|nr:hypothetical protein C8R44DRAFT_866102 [Mycena epipterygia]
MAPSASRCLTYLLLLVPPLVISFYLLVSFPTPPSPLPFPGPRSLPPPPPPPDSRAREIYPDHWAGEGYYAEFLMGRTRYWLAGPESGKKLRLPPRARLGTARPAVGESGTPRAALALLLQHVSWLRARLVGVSMGGAIAAAFVATLPNLVENDVVLVACAGLVESSDLSRTSKVISSPIVQTLTANPLVHLYFRRLAEERNAAEDPGVMHELVRLQSAYLPGFNRAISSSLRAGPVTGMRAPPTTPSPLRTRPALRPSSRLCGLRYQFDFNFDVNVSLVPGAGHALTWTHAEEVRREVSSSDSYRFSRRWALTLQLDASDFAHIARRITLGRLLPLVQAAVSLPDDADAVGENRRRIRDLTDDILRTLGHIADLSRGHENSFQAPELLTALGNLKADMLYVYSVASRTLPPARTRGLRGFRTQFKAWMKRDDIEGEIRRLREHANNCYLQFTAFSTARTEHTSRRVENTSLRVEQALVVNHVENHVRLQRLETMMARVLLETQSGQNIMNQTIDIISSDPTHRTIEFQYLSIQTLHLVDALQERLLRDSVDLPWDTVPLTLRLESTSPAYILHRILGMVLALKTSPTEVHTETIMSILDDVGPTLESLNMNSEALAWGLLTIQILLSDQYDYQLRHDLALQSSQKAVDLSQFSWES